MVPRPRQQTTSYRHRRRTTGSTARRPARGPTASRLPHARGETRALCGLPPRACTTMMLMMWDASVAAGWATGACGKRAPAIRAADADCGGRSGAQQTSLAFSCVSVRGLAKRGDVAYNYPLVASHAQLAPRPSDRVRPAPASRARSNPQLDFMAASTPLCVPTQRYDFPQPYAIITSFLSLLCPRSHGIIPFENNCRHTNRNSNEIRDRARPGRGDRRYRNSNEIRDRAGPRRGDRRCRNSNEIRDRAKCRTMCGDRKCDDRRRTTYGEQDGEMYGATCRGMYPRACGDSDRRTC